MRPNRSTEAVVELFRKWWQGGCLPRGLIYTELERHGTPLPVRTMDYGLAQAVRQRKLTRITGSDGGALYCLASFVATHPGLVATIHREPLRSLNLSEKARADRAVRKWLDYSARHGAHDLRPGHKCIACGYKPHWDPGPTY